MSVGAAVDRVHRLAGVDDQIDDDLLQLHAIGTDLSAKRAQLDCRIDPVLDQFKADQAQGLADDVVERFIAAQRVALARQGQNAAGDLAGSMGAGDDPLQCLVCFDQIGLRAAQPVTAGFAAAADRRQRLIDFMGDGRSQFTQGGHAGDMGQFASGPDTAPLRLVCWR